MGFLADLAGPHPILASLGWLLAGGAVGAGGAWAYSGGNAGRTDTVVSAAVLAVIIGSFGSMFSWVARRHYVRRSRDASR